MTDVEQVIACPACGAKNRVSSARVKAGLAAVCGKCRAMLPLESMGGTVQDAPIEVTDETFGREVEQSGMPVLVDLWAPWCPPCRMIAPVVDRLAKEFAGRVKVAKVNVDECPMTASRMRAGSIPTLLIFKEGREVDRMVGAMPAQELRRRVERVAG